MPETKLRCMVEIPKGSRNKYEWSDEIGAITFDRFLFSSVVYPLDYGMIPDTLAEDGDPLDAMVAVSEPTFPGCVIPVKPIALFKMRDDKGIDDKVLYASGVRDFERYRVDPSVPLASDFFVPDDDVPPPGVSVTALPSVGEVPKSR